LSLHQKALHPRVDQAGAELREIENADYEGEQARDVEKDDAAREAGKALGYEEAPGAQQQVRRALRRVSLRRRRCLRLNGGAVLQLHSSVEHVDRYPARLDRPHIARAAPAPCILARPAPGVRPCTATLP